VIPLAAPGTKRPPFGAVPGESMVEAAGAIVEILVESHLRGERTGWLGGNH
jgi:hypothetical protein